MSNRYKGGVISATPPTTTGGESGTASGAWTLEQQMQLQAAGLWPLQPTGPYIEDVFSTWLYTGNDSTQAINNGIDVSGKGGLVWLKGRSSSSHNVLYDTTRGVQNFIRSNTTDAQGSNSGGGTTSGLYAFNSDGFSIGPNWVVNINATNQTFASWTFRKQPKFFDVVTYTGNGVAGRQIPHNLGSVPGVIMVKVLSANIYWAIYHRSTGASKAFLFNSDPVFDIPFFNGTEPTSTNFSVRDDLAVNQAGETYVAYLFAHDAGGFGLTGTDNVISCGSYTGNGSTNGPVINLGYEPQWVMVKRSSVGGGIWTIVDNMRGMPDGSNARVLIPNTADAEYADPVLKPLATGFQVTSDNGAYNGNGSTIIYIAIRRGPMRVPTTGTSVFYPKTWTGTATTTNITDVGFSPDFFIGKKRSGNTTRDAAIFDRLRGVELTLYPNATVAEQTHPGITSFSLMTGYQVGGFDNVNSNTFFGPGQSYIHYSFKRAPSFMDVVCYTGNATAARGIAHNLGVAPEMIIVKGRTNTVEWPVWATSIALGSNVYLNLTNATAGGNTDVLNYNEVTNTPVPPTSTTFTVGTQARVNASGVTYVAYLFASAPGVSKVGSYTGTGALQTINCGFAAGSRFVMIKRTDSTGAWYYWDSARGITSGNDPYLLMNTADDETTGTNFVDTTSVGFQVTAAASGTVNANGASYIFLAIA